MTDALPSLGWRAEMQDAFIISLRVKRVGDMNATQIWGSIRLASPGHKVDLWAAECRGLICSVEAARCSGGINN